MPRQIQVARLIQAVMNSVPSNTDLHLEFSQDPNLQEPRIEIEHIRIGNDHLMQPEERSSAPATATTPSISSNSRPSNDSPERGKRVYS